LLLLGGVAGLVVLGGAGLVAYLYASPIIESYRHGMPFESEKWKARSHDDGVWWPTRLRMADDLVRRRILDGRPRGEVEQLLGPRDETRKFGAWHLVYYLGPERSLFSVDSEWLVVRLNGRGVVDDYRIVRD
jgi:hypothetical protein